MRTRSVFGFLLSSHKKNTNRLDNLRHRDTENKGCFVLISFHFFSPLIERKTQTQEKDQFIKKMTSKDFIFFYMPNAKYGEFGNWFPSSFSVSHAEICNTVFQNHDKECHNTDVMMFGCVEQYYMYCKALRFHNKEIQGQIMSTSNPKEQKRLGRSIDNYVASDWDPIKASIMLSGITAKFTQNEKLKRKLLATSNKILVEAASRDRVWGIGYSEKRAMHFQQHWGENLLGKALMKARQHILDSERADYQYQSYM